MGSLQFTTTFVQIIVRGCMESPAIRTILIILSGIAAFIFIPHWVGLLVVGTIFPPPAWAGGMVCIILVGIIAVIIFTVFMMTYECVKNGMRKRK